MSNTTCSAKLRLPSEVIRNKLLIPGEEHENIRLADPFD